MTYLIYLCSGPDMSTIGVRIGHECHSCRERNILLPWLISHMLSGKIAIHDKCADELISSWNSLAIHRISLKGDNIRWISGFPIVWKIATRLRAGRAKYCHWSICRIDIRLMSESILHSILEITPLARGPQQLLVHVLHFESVSCGDSEYLETHRNKIRKHFTSHTLKFGVILLSCCFTF